MRTLYLECNMGAAGDMLAAALLELHPDPQGFIDRLNALGLPGVCVEAVRSEKCGVRGTHLRVTVHETEEHSEDVRSETGHAHEPHEHGHTHHHHATPAGIRALLERLSIPEAVRVEACAVYDRIAEAEAYVHGTDIGHIHFHEVGSLDAVTDVTAVCLLVHELGVDRVVVSPICTGYGMVRCAHGILPVPAPATARLLKDAPIYAGRFEGELCTPTGAALLTQLADEYARMPELRVRAIGYGMGCKDFPAANCVRAVLGEENGDGGPNDRITCLECNVDDMTGEAVGWATERLLQAGARDVWSMPIQMKKGRPGLLLSCLCTSEEADRFATLLLSYTTTIGVRRRDMPRYVLERRVETVETPWGPLHMKHSEGYGVSRCKPEYEDLRAMALREGVTPEVLMSRLRPAGE